MNDVIKGREFLYNSEEDLCFWPVDNSDPKDKNIQKLRITLVHAIIEDPTEDTNDPQSQ